jgi:hypothetical protein
VTVYELLHGCKPFHNWQKFTIDDEELPADPAAAEQNNNNNNNNNGSKNSPRRRGSSASGTVSKPNFHISSRMPPEVVEFLRSILNLNKAVRLGCADGWEEIKGHSFFSGIDWKKVYAKQLQPPVQPDVTYANCSADAELADQLLDRKPRGIPQEQQKLFEGWDFNTELDTNSNKAHEPNNQDINRTAIKPEELKGEPEISVKPPRRTFVTEQQNNNDENKAQLINQKPSNSVSSGEKTLRTRSFSNQAIATGKNIVANHSTVDSNSIAVELSQVTNLNNNNNNNNNTETTRPAEELLMEKQHLKADSEYLSPRLQLDQTPLQQNQAAQAASE